MPWNLHEPIRGVYDFKSWGLDIVSFVKQVQEQGLLMVMRPSPFICAGLFIELLHVTKS